VTVGVWVGNFDRTPLRGSSGVTGAGPIFHAVMLAAERRAGSEDPSRVLVSRPEGLDEVTVCALSGERANAWCPSRTKEWLAAAGDMAPCSWHHKTDEGLLTVYPAEYRAWAAQAGFADATRPRSIGSSAAAGDAVSPPAARTPAAARPLLQIANPPDGATYSYDPTLRREFQALPLRVVTAHPTTVKWLVNGRTVATGSSEKTVSWPLAVGSHRIEVQDADGRRASSSVVVR